MILSEGPCIAMPTVLTSQANSATEPFLCLLLALEAKRALWAASTFLSQKEGKGNAFRSTRTVGPNLGIFPRSTDLRTENMMWRVKSRESLIRWLLVDVLLTATCLAAVMIQ